MNKCIIHCGLEEESLDFVHKDILCESCFLELCHHIETCEQTENRDKCEYEEIGIINERVQLRQELEEAEKEKENDKEKIMELVQKL